MFADSLSHTVPWKLSQELLFHCWSGESPLSKTTATTVLQKAVWTSCRGSSLFSTVFALVISDGKCRKWAAARALQWLTGQGTALSKKGISQMWRWDETPYVMHCAFLLFHTAHFPGLRQLHFNYQGKKISECTFCFKVQGF